MARRGSSVSDLKKKRKDLFKRPDSAIGRTKNSNQVKTQEKKTSKKSKPLSKVQERFKKRVSEGKSGFTGGPKGETVAEYRARQDKKIKEAARKRHEAFKAKRKLKIKNK